MIYDIDRTPKQRLLDETQTPRLSVRSAKPKRTE
jgi:hypothetical protein